MKGLDENWLTNGLIDFEYKKYVLLSYAKYVDRQFTDKKLYPELLKVYARVGELTTYKKIRSSLKNGFPKTLKGFDFENLKMRYMEKQKESEFLLEMDEIVDYGLGVLSEKLTDGEELLSQISEKVLLNPVGISPLNNGEGYLFFYSNARKEVDIFRYWLSPLEMLGSVDDKIKLSFLSKAKVSIMQTFEQIKKSLLKTHNELPNPATFVVASKVPVPYKETLIPIAKRKLMEKLAA